MKKMKGKRLLSLLLTLCMVLSLVPTMVFAGDDPIYWSGNTLMVKDGQITEKELYEELYGLFEKELDSSYVETPVSDNKVSGNISYDFGFLGNGDVPVEGIEVSTDGGFIITNGSTTTVVNAKSSSDSIEVDSGSTYSISYITKVNARDITSITEAIKLLGDKLNLGRLGSLLEKAKKYGFDIDQRVSVKFTDGFIYLPTVPEEYKTIKIQFYSDVTVETENAPNGEEVTLSKTPVTTGKETVTLTIPAVPYYYVNIYEIGKAEAIVAEYKETTWTSDTIEKSTGFIVEYVEDDASIPKYPVELVIVGDEFAEKVEITPDKAEMREGTNAAVTVIPKDDCYVESVKITGATSAKEITEAIDEEGKATFVVGTEKVIVTATFAAKEETKIVLSEANVVAIYGETDDEKLLNQLVVGVQCEEGFVEDAKIKISYDKDAGEQNVTLNYEGDETHLSSEATTKITINKAPVSVNVNNVAVKYGETYDLGMVTSPEGVKTIEFIVGLDLEDLQIEGESLTGAKTVVNLRLLDELPSWAQTLLALAGLENGVTVELDKLVSALEAAESTLAQVGISEETIDMLITSLTSLQTALGGEIEIALGAPLPKNIGVYLVGVVTADPNYETAVGVGALAITPNGVKADLDWNVHDENGAIALTAIKDYDLGAHVTKLYEVPAGMTEESAIAAANSEIEYLYAGVNLNGEVVLTQDLKAEDKLTGAYAEVASIVNWGNEMYYSMPIVRTLVVVPELADVTFADANENNAFRFTYGKDYELKVLVDGSENYDGEVTITYVGVTADGEAYHSTVAPTKVGAYTATALYSEKTNGEVVKAGIAVAAMAIEKQASGFAMYDKTATWTGNKLFVEVDNPDNAEVLYAVVNKDTNTVNVIIPDALKALVPELGATESLSTVPAKEAINALIEKVNAVTLPEGFEIPEGFVTELNRVLAAVNAVPNATVTINGKKPVDCGTYDVYAVTYSKTVKSAYAEAQLTINHAYASTWTADEADHWHAAICGHGVADKAAHTASDWIVDTAATSTAAGSKHQECTVCKYVMATATIPATGGNRPSGGGGGGGSTKYVITVEDTKNGILEVSSTKASSGTTVTITAVPEVGYKADDITVTTSKGKTVEVKDLGNGKYTFKMPADKVVVDGNFVLSGEGTVAEQKVIILTIDSVIAWVFDEYVANDVAPVIRNERTMLPARFVAEALGGVVTWNEADQSVTIVNGDTTIVIYIGQAFALVNGNPVELDSPAFIENSRTYLPIRFIAENLGATVTWDGAAQTVTIVPGN